MSSGSENQSLMAQSQSDGTVQELHKHSKISYTREFLTSLAELDTCKRLPSGFDQSILHEFGDTSNCWSQSCHHSDSGRWYDNLSRRSWKNSEHDGLLGDGAFPRVSGCIARVSAQRVREEGYHLLHRSNEPYRPPRPYKEVHHSGRQSNDSCNDETFGSSECTSLERAEDERRRRASFELVRKEQQKAIQEKQYKISDEHKENFDPDMVTLLENSVKDKRLVNKCNESEQCVVPPASNNNSVNSSSAQICASGPTLPPSFTGMFLEENIGRKSLTHSSVSEHLNVKADHTKSPILCSSEFAHQSVEEVEKPAGGISSNMKGGSKVYGVPHENVTEHNCLFSNQNEISRELLTTTSQSAKDEISEELYSCNKPTVTQEVLTCGVFEQSILSEINGKSSTQHQSMQGCSSHDTELQHLLSLLQTGTGVKYLAASAELNMGSSDRTRPFEFAGDSIGNNILSHGNGVKSDTKEAVCGTGFAKVQLTDASISLQKGSAASVTRNDASQPCKFPSPVTDNKFFPSKVDEFRSIGVNREGIMSSSCVKQTDLSEVNRNQPPSDDILAESGLDLQLKQGLKLNPVRDFDENDDSNIEICLPDEDSLITFDDSWFLPDEDSLITFDHSMFMPEEDSTKPDLLSSSLPVDVAEKPSDLNVIPSDEIPSQLGLEVPTSHYKSYDLLGLETPNHKLHAQQSYPQFHHTRPNLGWALTHLNSQRISTKSKPYPCNPPVLPHLFQHPNAEQTMFDHPVDHLRLQQTPYPGKVPPPYLLNRCPIGITPHLPTNQMACFRHELNPMQNLYLVNQQLNFGGLEMPNQYSTGPHVGGNNNPGTFNQPLENKLRAKQLLQPFSAGGRGQGTYGKQVDMGFWY